MIDSMAGVEWVDDAITDPTPASDEAVRAVEDALRVRLPADFLAVARVRQGARPEPADVDLPNGFGVSVLHLLHFEDEPFTSNFLAARYPFEGVLEKGIIPFALDTGGDIFCFNYREDYDNPSVVFWSVDWGAVPVAPDFTAFVALLHDD